MSEHSRLESKVRSYWGVDQADERGLLRIVEQEFGGKLNMVMDDASHFYEPTLTSFQILFPLLPSGGLYIIEDWAWEHWKEFHSLSHPWAGYQSPTQLIFELVEATGTSQDLITSVEVFEGFTIIERGPHWRRISPRFFLPTTLCGGHASRLYLGSCPAQPENCEVSTLEKDKRSHGQKIGRSVYCIIPVPSFSDGALIICWRPNRRGIAVVKQQMIGQRIRYGSHLQCQLYILASRHRPTFEIEYWNSRSMQQLADRDSRERRVGSVYNAEHPRSKPPAQDGPKR